MKPISWRELFQAQKRLYPRAALQDLLKALHQSYLGCGHFTAPAGEGIALLRREWEAEPNAAREAEPPTVEPLAGGFSRCHLQGLTLSPETLQRLFSLSSLIRTDREEAYMAALTEINKDIANGLYPASEKDRAFLAAYLPEAPRMLRHSAAFRAAYTPAYRVLSDEAAQYLPLFTAIDRRLSDRDRLLIALEGGSASGKTRLAALLTAVYGGDVVHMDDFFLRPEQRTPERYREPGGNVDRERFAAEVLPALKKGLPFSYRRFDCGRMALADSVSIRPGRLTVVEGAYSTHLSFGDPYDLTVFLSIDPATQQDRLRKRNGENGLRNFLDRWIPLEEAYFSATDIFARCDLTLATRETETRLLLPEETSV